MKDILRHKFNPKNKNGYPEILIQKKMTFLDFIFNRRTIFVYEYRDSNYYDIQTGQPAPTEHVELIETFEII